MSLHALHIVRDHKTHQRATYHVNIDIFGQIHKEQPQAHTERVNNQKRLTPEFVRKGTIENNKQCYRIGNKTYGGKER